MDDGLTTALPDPELIRLAKRSARARKHENDFAVALLVHPRYLKICSYVANRYQVPREHLLCNGAGNLVLFLRKRKTTRWEGLYSLVYRIAENEARQFHRIDMAGVAKLGEFESDIDGENTVFSDNGASMESIEERIDRDRARAALRYYLDKSGKATPEGPMTAAAPPVAAPKRRGRAPKSQAAAAMSKPMPAYQAELIDIRDQLHLTIGEMALQIGVTDSTLSSYLYGRVKKVPERRMQRARALLNENNKYAMALRKRFGPQRSMAEIIADWEQRLEIAPASNSALGRALNVASSTVSRWRSGKDRPSVTRLGQIDLRVEKVRKKLIGEVPAR